MNNIWLIVFVTHKLIKKIQAVIFVSARLRLHEAISTYLIYLENHDIKGKKYNRRLGNSLALPFIVHFYDMRGPCFGHIEFLLEGVHSEARAVVDRGQVRHVTSGE